MIHLLLLEGSQYQPHQRQDSRRYINFTNYLPFHPMKSRPNTQLHQMPQEAPEYVEVALHVVVECLMKLFQVQNG
ncbi:MAG: hypothetical protein DRG76_02140 [Deltaproteobacteria bacterium]|nr:MAG: hypothetical protein DRG76_02140 [Deltaproteobacteria bacterium]